MTIPNITNKQKEILTLFPQFRFINRKHTQQFLGHKDEKTIQTWLNDLLEKEYIQKVEYKGQNQFPPKPVTYCIGKNGIRLLKSQETFPENFLTNLYRENERTDSFIANCFLLFDICLELSKASDCNDVFQYITKSKYIQPDSDFNFLTKLHPNLSFTKKIKGRKIKWYLLEIFSHTFPNQNIRRKLRAYVRFLTGQEWTDTLGNNFPTIFFVCSSEEMLSYIRQYTKKKLQKYDIEDADISFALVEDLKREGVRGEIWKELLYTLDQ